MSSKRNNNDNIDDKLHGNEANRACDVAASAAATPPGGRSAEGLFAARGARGDLEEEEPTMREEFDFVVVAVPDGCFDSRALHVICVRPFCSMSDHVLDNALTMTCPPFSPCDEDPSLSPPIAASFTSSPS
mmetsp:Transcript_7630/g.15274  ORF Transcript_7630/g.15274 Transcript_7630/m.15274 type:complete len:131 (-) Transcript_7630:602-994(-)